VNFDIQHPLPSFIKLTSPSSANVSNNDKQSGFQVGGTITDSFYATASPNLSVAATPGAPKISGGYYFRVRFA
jgi:hypothetical protein